MVNLYFAHSYSPLSETDETDFPFLISDGIYSGYFDIKQSLSIKRRQDRTEALQLPDETDPTTLLTLGQREYKNGNTEIAVLFISKAYSSNFTTKFKYNSWLIPFSIYLQALELNPSDQNALVARSKCYLLLGDPTKGLQVSRYSVCFSPFAVNWCPKIIWQDAETALSSDKANIRAIYQKAEALYFLGQFELSLMFFHRGLRLRPELTSFRLGVQKTQEAIEKTIGGFEKCATKTKNPTTIRETPSDNKNNKQQLRPERVKAAPMQSKNFSNTSSAKKMQKHRPKTGVVNSVEKREARKLLGELYVDKEYLENLLKHPNLKRADTGTEHISTLANDAVRFLNTRQEFWRQQRPATSFLLTPKSIVYNKWNKKKRLFVFLYDLSVLPSRYI